MSEYSETKRGCTTTIKLGASPPAERSAPARKPAAEAAQVADAESKIAYRKFLDEVGVSETQAREALRGLS